MDGHQSNLSGDAVLREAQKHPEAGIGVHQDIVIISTIWAKICRTDHLSYGTNDI
ncbi:MAG: hypothetical protein ACLU30_18380 [Odoribacter splanchnicus]